MEKKSMQLGEFHYKGRHFLENNIVNGGWSTLVNRLFNYP